MRKTITRVVGIDLGDKWSVVGGVDRKTGELMAHRRVRTEPGAMGEFFAELPVPARVVIETGTHAPWVARVAERHGHQVLTAQARKLRAIWQNDRKSDDADADILWQLGDARPELLHPIRHRSESSQEHLVVLRLREQAVDTRTALINAVRGSVKSLGHRVVKCDAGTFHRRATEDLPKSLEPGVLPLLSAIEQLTATIARYDATVQELIHSAHQRATRRLLEIHGVGPLTALAFVLVIDDPTRFRKSRDVGPYLGLVPKRDQSGDGDRQLSITKAGDRMMRRLLGQCAHHILGRFGQDCDLRRWGLPRLEAGGKSAKKRTLVAVARRLAVLMHRLWMDDCEYDPLRLAKRRGTESTEAVETVVAV